MIEVHSDLIKEFKHWVFPGGEVGVKFEFNEINNTNSIVKVIWGIKFQENWHTDFFIVANAINALREHFQYKVGIELEIPYLPYARQDRICGTGEAFSLKVFANMVNTLNHSTLSTHDVHNPDKLVELFDYRCSNIRQSDLAKHLPVYDYLIAPDKGASKKINNHLQVRNGFAKVLIMEKVRKDGKIVYNTDYNIPAGSLVCVVDDLSDGNGTFVALANALNYKDFAAFDLYVTHGLFSKGLDNLRGIYDHVYCKNLMNQSLTGDSLLTVLN